LLRRWGCNRRLSFQFGLRLRRWLGLWDRSALEEIISQGGFEIGNEFSDDLGLAYAERGGRSVAYGFEFWLANRRFGIMRNSGGKKTLAQGRFKVGNKFLENAWSGNGRSGRLDGRRLGGGFGVDLGLSFQVRNGDGRLWGDFFGLSPVFDGCGGNFIGSDFGGGFVDGELGDCFDWGDFLDAGWLRCRLDLCLERA